MGVRFHCPNGHKLNVKAYLAGKRGICPDCDAKFIIPMTSGGKATVVEDDPEPVARTPAAAAPTEVQTAPLATAPAVAPPAAPGPPPAQTESTAEPDVWYVRPAKGDQQYGPASTEVMQSWIAEQRIKPDSWVWKNGWPEWKFGSEAFAELTTQENTTAPPPVGSAPPQAIDPNTSPSKVKKPKARGRHRPSPRSRRQQAQKNTIILGTLVLLLAVAVALVLATQ